MKKSMIAVVVIGTLVGGATGWKIAEPSQPTLTSQQAVASATKRTIESVVNGDGKIQVAEKESIVSTERGTVEEILVENGERVEKGTKLIEFTNGDTITAPIDGVVNLNNITESSSIPAGSVVGEIQNYNKLEAVVAVDELDINQVKVGQSVTLEQNDRTYKGKVQKIANEGQVNNSVSTFDVTISLEQTNGLRAGMTVQASIVTAKAEQVLSVPIEAVQKMGEKYFVRVKSNHPNTPAQLRPVEVGIHDELHMEIKKGLSEGEIVLLPVKAVSKDQTQMMKFGPGGGMMRMVPKGTGGNR